MNRRVDARVQLRTSYDNFTSFGMEAFAERASRELLATGETVRKRNVETRDHLTPQERQIAELARIGLSNPEIGARLFLSRRTVEWHLRHVFGKLGIKSRRELASALARSAFEAVPNVSLTGASAAAAASDLARGFTGAKDRAGARGCAHVYHHLPTTPLPNHRRPPYPVRR